ncbi:hypothetical protein ACEWY4_004204 [Coilia grayii]|uniref:DDE Tnp4 domain-containing protein n=1 Tax=Coilia grayii TaxID=363190 RepID=A0ABD1KKW4_9TELE
MDLVLVTFLCLVVNLLSLIRIRRFMVLWHLLRGAAILPTVTAPLPQPRSRSQWMKIRNRQWWETTVLTEFTDNEWKANFRMSRISFMKLCDLMSTYMAPEVTTVRAPIPLLMLIAVVLYKLGSCGEYRIVANEFGIHKSTVKKFVYQFCLRDCQKVGPPPVIPVTHSLHTQLPTVIKYFFFCPIRFEALYHIPQVTGLIDGTHIPILPPSDGYRDFINRKGWPSYVLQAVVDDRCCFWSISCRMPGSAHDANVLSQSDLYKRAHLLPQCVRTIEGQDIPLFLIGDPAYPLLSWLMKGYKNSPRLSPEQESFNTFLSSAQVGVENTFGMLKARWRVLPKRSEFHFTFPPNIIATCCALHNFCQREKDAPHSNWLQEAIDPTVSYPQPSYTENVHDNTSASSAREALTTYMATHFPLRTRH